MIFAFKRSGRIIRITATTLLLSMASQVLLPVTTYALTSGPTTPEVQSFLPISATDMVDPFTGDFSYNLPLFELPGPNGGYPFNLIYNAGIGMDQEASWVGLGWNLNPGAINRQMRGIPDEWDGTQTITREMDIKPDWTLEVEGGFSPEFFGLEKNFFSGAKIYYNSYKGCGFAVSGSTSTLNSLPKTTFSGGVGIEVSLDSQEGLGVNPSLSLRVRSDQKMTYFTFGSHYGSKAGLSGLSLSMYTQSRHRLRNVESEKIADRKYYKDKGIAGFGGSAGLSLYSPGYTPQIQMPMKGRSVDITYKGGAAAYGVFPNMSIKGSFTTSYISEKSVTRPAFGYMAMERAYESPDALMDFNREKDGMIRSSSPNLAIPSTTFDIYSITGHGVSGSYRGFRNDVTILKDATVYSSTAGGAAGVDVGTPLPSPHIGVHATVNMGETTSGPWRQYNDLFGHLSGNLPLNKGYERAYFKKHGEHTADNKDEMSFMNGAEPVRPDITDDNGGLYQQFYLNTRGINNPNKSEREKRGTLIHPVKNNITGDSGYYVISENGTRYKYGKVCLNTKQTEAIFSINEQEPCATRVNISESRGVPAHDAGEDKFLSKTSLNNPYAYAYQLTEITGPDYIDADNDGNVNENDLGYWVKFTYATEEEYKWRAPFSGASVSQGYISNIEDNKASYLFGIKKVSFLEKVETKTHIAIFEKSERQDAAGASGEYQNNNETGNSLKKLDKIRVYARGSEQKPVKTIYFEYDYSLCKGIPNYKSQADGKTYTFINNKFTKVEVQAHVKSGKLTLKKVYFTYENNVRGGLSPYEFGYDERLNFNYNTENTDRWGYYKEKKNCSDEYVQQFEAENENFDQKAAEVAAWSLSTIKLPTGGKFEITYESDDYGYVQNKKAMQMFEIKGMSNIGDFTIKHNRFGYDKSRRVYFQLEKPVDPGNIDQELKKYSDNTGKLYYKAFINLLDGSRPEYVKGYASLEKIGVDDNCKRGDKYHYAFAVLGDINGYHPVSVAAWQHIRTNEPKLMGLGSSGSVNDKSGKNAILAFAKGISSILGAIGRTLTGYRHFAYTNMWGQKLADNQNFKSYIRLNSPDQKKYGGGIRVKKLLLSDEWNPGEGEKPAQYGQVYDYTMTENGIDVISSGVATYEPQTGGDENALRYSKDYADNLPLMTDNNLFFEYPVNESYYPSPDVGYRKVTVRSLASYYSANSARADNTQNIPVGIMATGGVVHEFYTAKEFPVIPRDSDIDKSTRKLVVPIPFIGSLSTENFAASQGYSIELNDMHGKPRKVSYFAQDRSGNLLKNPNSSVTYEYFENSIVRGVNGGEDYHTLNNLVTVLEPAGGNRVRKDEKSVGVDHEFFVDMRQSYSRSSSGGFKLNTDILMFGLVTIPAFTPIPNAMEATSTVRMAVSNKVIHRAGILKSIKTDREGAITFTEFSCFDGFTGQPLLTATSDNYGNPVYDYTVPGHNVYAGMGGAYQNIGVKFTAMCSPTSNTFITSINDPVADAYLQPGDVLSIASGSFKSTARVLRKQGSIWLLDTEKDVSGIHHFEIISSGYKNMLTVPAGNVKALSDPSEKLKISNQ